MRCKQTRDELNTYAVRSLAVGGCALLTSLAVEPPVVAMVFEAVAGCTSELVAVGRRSRCDCGNVLRILNPCLGGLFSFASFWWCT